MSALITSPWDSESRNSLIQVRAGGTGLQAAPFAQVQYSTVRPAGRVEWRIGDGVGN